MKTVDSAASSAAKTAISGVGAFADSHAPATKPSGKHEFQPRREDLQNGLDAWAAVPLHERLVVDYREAAALGIAPERTLRRLVAMGRVKRAVLRMGRSVRFVVADLLDELRQVEA